MKQRKELGFFTGQDGPEPHTVETLQCLLVGTHLRAAEDGGIAVGLPRRESRYVLGQVLGKYFQPFGVVAGRGRPDRDCFLGPAGSRTWPRSALPPECDCPLAGVQVGGPPGFGEQVDVRSLAPFLPVVVLAR